MTWKMHWDDDAARYFESGQVNALREEKGYEAHRYPADKRGTVAAYLTWPENKALPNPELLEELFEPFEPFTRSFGAPKATFLQHAPDLTEGFYGDFEKVAATVTDPDGYVQQEKKAELRGRRKDLERQLRGYGEDLREPLGEIRSILMVWYVEVEHALEKAEKPQAIERFRFDCSRLWMFIKEGWPSNHLVDVLEMMKPDGWENAKKRIDDGEELPLERSLTDVFLAPDVLPELAECQIGGVRYNIRTRDSCLEQTMPLHGPWEAREMILSKAALGKPLLNVAGEPIAGEADNASSSKKLATYNGPAKNFWEYAWELYGQDCTWRDVYAFMVEEQDKLGLPPRHNSFNSFNTARKQFQRE